MKINKIVSTALLGMLLWTQVQAEQSHIDANLPEYQPKSGISGNLNSIGSDTLNNLMTFWAEELWSQTW